MASATAFTTVKLVGACYLIYVGIRKLLEREVPLRRPVHAARLRDRLAVRAHGRIDRGRVPPRRRKAFRYGSGAIFIGLGTLAALTKRN